MLVADLVPVVPRGAGPARRRRERPRDHGAGGATWAGRHRATHGPYHEDVVRSLLVLRALTQPTTPAASWPRRPRRCPRTSAGCATGTTATCGCATPPSRSRRCSRTASSTRRRSLARLAAARDRGGPGRPADHVRARRRARPRRARDALAARLCRIRARCAIGNGAAQQYQADVIGEVMVALAVAARARASPSRRTPGRCSGRCCSPSSEQLDRPDNGMWEIRGEPRFFTHSRVMMWAAFDRGVRAVERAWPRRGRSSTGEALRDRLRAEIDERGVDASGTLRAVTTARPRSTPSLLLSRASGFCRARRSRGCSRTVAAHRAGR